MNRIQRSLTRKKNIRESCTIENRKMKIKNKEELHEQNLKEFHKKKKHNLELHNQNQKNQSQEKGEVL
jgi:hypothetical protein